MKRFRVVLACCGLTLGLALAGATAATHAVAKPAAAPMLPAISDWQYLGNSVTPPSQSACNAVGRRCFDPAAMHNSYNYASLLAAGNQGQGKTIAIVDAFGASTIRQDLYNFSTQFGLPVLCGSSTTAVDDPSGNCASNVSPRFDIICPEGCRTAQVPPLNNSFGQEAGNLWSLEVALDVEWAHATAPLANIVLVTTPTAETLGVQGFPVMMAAEQYVIDNHLADVISQSFGAGEGSFHNGLATINNLRQAYVDAQANNVTVLASSGDGGTTNGLKEPVKNSGTIPYPSVIWPASDPLVTSVGGTYLCTNATTGTSVDSVSPPSACQAHPGAREVGWIAGGGGYSILFSRPDFQNNLPTGSTFVGSSVGAPGPNSNMRGVPDVAYQASARTGVLVYVTEPQPGSTTTGCGGASPCSTGWYVVGGTSSGSPQWAGLIALTDQIAGRDVGYINPALYTIASDPSKYGNDFYDITAGCNQTTSIPGYCASTGWDAVTGLGTPNVANLIPDLISATQ